MSSMLVATEIKASGSAEMHLATATRRSTNVIRFGIAPPPWAIAFLLLSTAAPAPARPDDAPYELVLRGGRVADGTGNPWFRADVAVRGDRIARIGTLTDDEVASARRVIDASGLVVAPGFIDMHSHSDRTLFTDGSSPSKVRQGVTTEVLGEQSSGGPRLDALEPATLTVDGRERSVRTLGDYLDALRESGTSVNVATYVGLRNVWAGVMGDSFARPTP
jgi:N-acyl-D-aspartate/D-glutamate deacylase